MPLKVQQLVGQRAEFDWEYLGETIHVVYNPQGFTPAVEEKIREQTDAQNASGRAIVDLLRMFLVDWDLVENVPELEDSNGVALPDPETGEVRLKDEERLFGTNREKMMTLPIVFLSDCISGITGDINALRAEGKPSTGG